MLSIEKRNYYTTKSLAEYLAMEEGTLVKWRKRGWGPIPIKTESGSIRYPAQNVEKWEEEMKAAQNEGCEG